ncbi:MAG: glycosyltransferase family 87 protein, partial [Rhizomicrobium sp.]
TRTVILEQGSTGFNKIQSVFAWVRLWGGSVPLAYALQGVVSMVTAILVVLIWRGGATKADKGALLCLSALLTTPYCLDYDLTALAPAIALLASQGIARGFRPYEKTLLAALWLVPIVTRGAAGTMHIPLGVMTMLGVGALVVWHTSRGRQGALLVPSEAPVPAISEWREIGEIS